MRKNMGSRSPRINRCSWVGSLLILALLLSGTPRLVVAGEAKFSDGHPAAADEAAIAVMSDEQVRQHLIAQARERAAAQAAARSSAEANQGLVGLINGMKSRIDFVKQRIQAIQHDALTLDDQPASGLVAYLTAGAQGGHPVATIVSVVALFLAGGLVDGVFRHATRSFRRQLEQAKAAKALDKPVGLTLLALLELLSITVFIVAVLALFFMFMDRTVQQRVLVAAYLTAIVIIRVCRLGLQMVLAPRTANLRMVPVTNGAAIYIYRGMMTFFALGSLGLLTCGIAYIAGSSKAGHFVMVSVVGLLMASVLVVMVVHQRKAVAAFLAKGVTDKSLQAKLAHYWHYGALLIVGFGFVYSIFERLLYDQMGLAGVRAILLIGLYLLLDLMLRRALAWAFALVRNPGDWINTLPGGTPAGSDSRTPDLKGDRPADENGAHPSDTLGPVNIHYFNQGVTTALRVALAAYMFFWLLGIWGIHLPLGREIADATFDILVAFLICYICWALINSSVQQRIDAEMPEQDEEMEEGGAGGSRVGTLLVLLRKFVSVIFAILVAMIVLSRMGVDIGPLIAGAGVVGLAIGFGAQTLVKDIISGLFFLIDDAFRVGDYVDVGAAKGTVEQISIRSFKLRDPKGMLTTIPFGDLGQVKNFSRDYIITKLSFRVRYDTDVELVRKIIKKDVYKPILTNPDLGPKLLGKIKSQGVRQLEDSAMIMRVKFKTIPGEQFIIKREVFRLMQEAFRKKGVEFAHRNVTVYMPNEDGGKSDDQLKRIQKAGAAALTLEEAEEAQQAGQKPSKD